MKNKHELSQFLSNEFRLPSKYIYEALCDFESKKGELKED